MAKTKQSKLNENGKSRNKPVRRTPEKIWTDNFKKALKQCIPYEEFYDYQDLVDQKGYTEDDMWEEFFCDYDIKLVPERNNMVISFYNTNHYRSQGEMLESLIEEANERHQNNWWEGILDEDDFCDCEAGDDPEYLEIMSVASFISHLSWECCEILWPNMQKEDY